MKKDRLKITLVELFPSCADFKNVFISHDFLTHEAPEVHAHEKRSSTREITK